MKENLSIVDFRVAFAIEATLNNKKFSFFWLSNKSKNRNYKFFVFENMSLFYNKIDSLYSYFIFVFYFYFLVFEKDFESNTANKN